MKPSLVSLYYPTLYPSYLYRRYYPSWDYHHYDYDLHHYDLHRYDVHHNSGHHWPAMSDKNEQHGCSTCGADVLKSDGEVASN